MKQTDYLDHPMPSLAKAKELCSFIKRPLNGEVVLINCILPSVNKAGLSIDNTTQKKNQKEFNQSNGCLVVFAPDNTVVSEGDKVILKASAEQGISFSRKISTKEYYDNIPQTVKDMYIKKSEIIGQSNFDNREELLQKEYVILVIHPAHFALLLDE